MASKFDAELSLKSIELTDKLIFEKESNHLIDFKLVYPRPTVASKATSKVFQLKDGRWNCEEHTWTEAILFKETLSGRTGMEIAVSEAVSDKELASLLRTAGSSFVKLLGDLASDLVGLKSLSPLAELPTDAFSKSISSSDNTTTLAYGVIDIPAIDAKSLSKDGAIDIEVILKAQAPIKKTVNTAIGSRGTGMRAPRKHVVKKGETVATLHLLLRDA